MDNACGCGSTLMRRGWVHLFCIDHDGGVGLLLHGYHANSKASDVETMSRSTGETRVAVMDIMNHDHGHEITPTNDLFAGIGVLRQKSKSQKFHRPGRGFEARLLPSSHRMLPRRRACQVHAPLFEWTNVGSELDHLCLSQAHRPRALLLPLPVFVCFSAANSV